MSLKRVVLHKGDTVEFCFVPADCPKTLAAFDGIVHQRQKTSMFISTYKHGFPLCLDNMFLLQNAPDGEHQIGLTTGGDKLIGSFKFETIAQQNTPKSGVNVSTSQIETIVQSTFEDTARLMASEFDLDDVAVREFLKHHMETMVEESARRHYKRYSNAAG